MGYQALGKKPVEYNDGDCISDCEDGECNCKEKYGREKHYRKALCEAAKELENHIDGYRSEANDFVIELIKKLRISAGRKP